LNHYVVNRSENVSAFLEFKHDKYIKKIVKKREDIKKIATFMRKCVI